MRAIIVWLEGLPIQGTAAVVALLSGVITATVWSMSRRPHWRWSVALMGPFVVAAALYTLPALLEATASDYGGWRGLFIAIWGGAGVATSLLVALAWTFIGRPQDDARRAG